MTFWWLSSTSDRAQENRNAVHVREELVPAQTLELEDNAGQPSASIALSDAYLTLTLYSGAPEPIAVNIYRDGRVGLILGTLTAIVEDEGYSLSDDTPGTHAIVGEWKSFKKNPNWLIRLRRLIPLDKRHSWKTFDDPDVLPTEDLELRNRKGWRFAAVGLDASGDPGIAFADSEGAVRAALLQRHPEYLPRAEPDWWDLALFDRSGKLRLSLELHSGKVPNLVVFADDVGSQYYADFHSGKLTPKDNESDAALSWIAPMKARPQRPIRLSDNRKRTMWSAP